MAFFDDISKKISKATQTVAQKTKDVTGVAKLNLSILEEEKKINKTYAEIGKLYVEKFADTADESLVELIATVKGAEDKISEYKEQIKEIKGVMVCEKCGAEVAANTAFCTACGNAMPVKESQTEAEQSETQQPEAEQSAKKVCAICGVENEATSNFCIACGTKLD